ncbi:aldo/keto reductase [Halostella sp. PRR32]|uniref:aldo/keto reductase n=1 Tax=Halostella sp. PRR32 TaxID=3098147 RepID=UPI002B1DE269|nr:aldo/keto reductase [Halostella sp. PRR32]
MTADGMPRVGVGTYDLEPSTCADAVETALDIGYRHVDTAEMYGNESAVGRGLRTAEVERSDVFLASKIHSKNLAFDDVIDHAQESCKRLGVESLDLLYVHWPIRAYDPESTLAAFDELYDRDVIDAVGVSNFTPSLLAEALDRLETPLFAHQVECHPLLQQDRLRRRAREDGHYLVAYSPLAKGAVTEVPELVEIAEKHGATPAQISLAWLLSKENVAVIPRSSSESHLRENHEARRIELDSADVARIDAINRTRRQVDFDGAPWRG